MQHLRQRRAAGLPQSAPQPPRRNLGLTPKQTRAIAVGTGMAMTWLTLGPAAQAAVTGSRERGHTRALNAVEMAHIKGSLSVLMSNRPMGGASNEWEGQVGDVSTATGNKQTDLPLVGWKVKGGRLAIGFALVHNSVNSYNNASLGAKWTHSYDLSLVPVPDDPDLIGSQAKVTYHQGNNQTYEFKGNIDGSFSAPTGVYDTLSVTGSGTSSVYTVTTKAQIKYQFVSSADGVTWYCNQISDRNGNAITISRNTSGQVTQVSDGSRALTFTYTSGRLSSVSDPISRTWSFTYNAANDLTQVSYPLLSGDPTVYKEQFGYSTSHNITSLTDKRGKVWTFGYSGDAITSETDPLNHSTTYGYGSSQTTITDANGNVIKHNYTSGRLTSVVDGGNFTESYGYNSLNQKTSMTDKRGKLWTYTYDSRGNPLTATDPLSHTTTYTYNLKNDVLTQTTHLGYATTYTYNAAGNLTGVSDPLSHATTFTVNPTGQVTALTNALNHTTYFGYNSNGDRTTVTNALGHITTTGYTTLGWANSVTDGTNRTTSTTYDTWGRVAIVTAPGSRATSFVYDANGNKTSVTDPRGKVTSFAYDDAGRLTASTDPLSRTVSYGYDLGNRKTSFTDGRGKVTTYGYNSRNLLTSIGYPDGTGDSYAYNASGALSSKTDGRGVTVTNTYDDAGRLTGKGYSDSTPSVSFAYDNDNRKTGMTDGTGTTSYVYDNASRLTSRSAPGTGILSVSFGYDNADRLTSRTTAGTSITTFGYDNAGRMTTTTSPGGSSGLTTGYTYDSASRPLTTTFPNGAVETKSYDATTADLTSVVSKTSATGTTFSSHTYTYRTDGRKTGETTPGSSVAYTYDDGGQLTGETRTGSNAFTASYTYDNAGNRLTKTVGSVTENYTYDNANKLLSAGSKSYTYDLAGNTTSVTNGSVTTNLAWDGEERIKSVGADTYTYNGIGQRTKKVQSGSTFNYTVSDDSIDSDVLSDGAATYLHGAGLIGETRSGTSKFYHADALGTTRAVTNTSVSTTDTLTTDAFGMTVASTGSTPSPFGFAGQHGYQSDTTGLKRLGHRYYDAATGRFLSRDPIQAGENWYVYCEGDPVNWIDPLGLEQEEDKDKNKRVFRLTLSMVMKPDSPPSYGAGIGVDEGDNSFDLGMGDDLKGKVKRKFGKQWALIVTGSESGWGGGFGYGDGSLIVTGGGKPSFGFGYGSGSFNGTVTVPINGGAPGYEVGWTPIRF